MISRLLTIFLVLLGVAQSSYPQKSIFNTQKQKVKIVVSDFNKTLFKELDAKKAIQSHFYVEKIDAIDLKFGFESEFFNETESFLDLEAKTDYFTMEFYWNRWYGSLLPLIWSLGTNKISNSSKLCDLDDAMAQNQKLRKVWDRELARIELRKRLPRQDFNEKNVDEYLYLTKQLNTTIEKQISSNLLAKNLKFISEHVKIKQEVFEGREYFTVENQIFIYKLIIRDGVPKITSINCNC